MTNQLLDEDSPEFRWISRTIRTVEKRLGGSTGWNGRIELDLARSDRDRMDGGTLIVRDDTVLDPLRAAARPNPTAEQAAEAAAAISTVAREAAVAVAGPTGSQHELALVAGTAEMWSHWTRGELVDDIGLVHAVPSLAGHNPERLNLHLHATGTARGLLEGLAERSKQPVSGIAERILTTSSDRRWTAIADVAIDLRVAGEQRDAACIDLAAEGRRRYAGVTALIAAPTTPQQKYDDGCVLGDQIAENLVRQMDGIPPSAPGYLWAAGVVQAVQDRTGLKTRWNGRIYRTTDPQLGGAVYPDDTMTLSEDHVIAPIRTAYTKQSPLTEAEVTEAVHAVHYTAHECAHASGPHPEVIDGELDPIDVALEEGLVEVWTYRNRSSIVQDIGMDRNVPAIVPHAARDMLSYAGYGNAAFGLVDDLAVLSGRSSDEVTLLMLAAEPGERWGLIADLALDKQLPGLPDQQRQELRSELAAALRKDYEPVVSLQAEAKSPSRNLSDIQEDSYRTGRRAVARLADRIGAVATRGDPDAEVSPEIRTLRSVALLPSTRADRPPAADGGVAVARPATEQVSARTTPAGGRGSSPSRG